MSSILTIGSMSARQWSEGEIIHDLSHGNPCREQTYLTCDHESAILFQWPECPVVLHCPECVLTVELPEAYELVNINDYYPANPRQLQTSSL